MPSYNCKLAEEALAVKHEIHTLIKVGDSNGRLEGWDVNHLL